MSAGAIGIVLVSLVLFSVAAWDISNDITEPPAPRHFAGIAVNPENGALFAITSSGDVWVSRNTDNRSAWRKCGKVQPGRDWSMGLKAEWRCPHSPACADTFGCELLEVR